MINSLFWGVSLVNNGVGFSFQGPRPYNSTQKSTILNLLSPSTPVIFLANFTNPSPRLSYHISKINISYCISIWENISIESHKKLTKDIFIGPLDTNGERLVLVIFFGILKYPWRKSTFKSRIIKYSKLAIIRISLIITIFVAIWFFSFY